MKILATRYTLIAASFFFGIAAAVAIAYAGTSHGADASPATQLVQMTIPF